MMLSLQLLLLMLLSNMQVTNTSKNFEQPNWLKMCEHLKKCSYPVYLTESAMIHMAKQTDIKLLRQGSGYSQNITEGTLNTTRLCESTGPLQDGVQDEHSKIKTSRKEEAASERTQPRPTQSNQTHSHQFVVPAKIRRRNCSLLSMAKSKTYSNTIYLLLQCRNMKKCPVNLHFVDFKAQKMLNGRIPFWNMRSGRSQIFTGPCVKHKTANCLYMVKLERAQVSITANKEPATTSKHLALLSTNYFSGFRGKSLVCSVYNTRDLLCLSDIRKPYHVELRLDSMILWKRTLDWLYDRFDGINDFKTDRSTDEHKETSYAVIVLDSTVVAVSIDEAKKMIKTEDSVAMKAMTVTVTNGVVILHSKELEQPFYTCKIENLSWCQGQRK